MIQLLIFRHLFQEYCYVHDLFQEYCYVHVSSFYSFFGVYTPVGFEAACTNTEMKFGFSNSYMYSQRMNVACKFKYNVVLAENQN